MSPATVVVFARAPERGRVKTRLAAAVGEDAALALHRAFLVDTLALVERAGARPLLAHTGAASFPEAQGFDVAFEQRGGDFGERVDHALREARRLAPEGPLAILGVDAPHLEPQRLRGALERLHAAGAVLGPCPGGGFYLLGFGGVPVPVAAAFRGPNEAARALRLLHESGLAPELLDPFFDVDVPEDLIALLFHIELSETAAAGWVPTHTREALRELGISVVANEGGGTRGHALARNPPS